MASTQFRDCTSRKQPNTTALFKAVSQHSSGISQFYGAPLEMVSNFRQFWWIGDVHDSPLVGPAGQNVEG